MTAHIAAGALVGQRAASAYSKPAHGLDEVFEADDDDEASTCSDTDTDSDIGNPSPPRAALVAMESRQRLVTTTMPPPTDQAALLETARRLREDNARLRVALVKSQRDNEMLAHDSNEESNNSADFDHILALAREFDDFDTDGDAGDCTGSVDAEVFAMDSPRADDSKDRDCTDGDSEAGRLRRELEESRAEVSALEVHFKTRDAELRGKFHALWEAVCGGGNDNPAQTRGHDSDSQSSDEESVS